LQLLSILKNIKNFLLTAFIGGMVILLPVVIVFKVAFWLLNSLSMAFEPISTFFSTQFVSHIPLAEILAFTAVFLLCFIIGVLVQTVWGRYVHGQLEQRLLVPIPGYTLIRDILSQFKNKDGGSFTRPVMLKAFQSEQLVLGYITDELEDHFAVFVPTSPSPFNGFVIFAPKADVKHIEGSAKSVMNLIVGCGVGSAKTLTKDHFKTP
jgi:uncharacterized membrane protein